MSNCRCGEFKNPVSQSQLDEEVVAGVTDELLSEKLAVFHVDAQKGFTPICPDELPVTGGDEIVDELMFLATKADVLVGSKDAHPHDAVWTENDQQTMGDLLQYPNADRVWKRHCVVGTVGCELLDGLPKPMDYDFFVYKGIEPDLHPYGACYHDLAGNMSTGVIEYLKANDVTTVLVGGLAYDFCVGTTALQLKDAGFKVAVYKPSCRSISTETESNMESNFHTGGIDVLESHIQLDEFIQNL